MSGIALCGLCGQPMPKGEEMFKYHGYSGNCPTIPLRIDVSPSSNAAPQAPTADQSSTAPLPEGVGQGELAVAAPTPRTNDLFKAYEVDMDATTLREGVEKLERELAAAQKEVMIQASFFAVECDMRKKAEAALAEAQAEIARLLALLVRYRNETPLGHQPHMIAHEADAAIDAARGKP